MLTPFWILSYNSIYFLVDCDLQFLVTDLYLPAFKVAGSLVVSNGSELSVLNSQDLNVVGDAIVNSGATLSLVYVNQGSIGGTPLIESIGLRSVVNYSFSLR